MSLNKSQLYQDKIKTESQSYQKKNPNVQSLEIELDDDAVAYYRSQGYLVEYVDGGNVFPTDPPPTRSDSLALYNQALAQEKFYLNNGYTPVESWTDFTDPSMRAKLIEETSKINDDDGYYDGKVVQSQIDNLAPGQQHYLGTNTWGDVPGTGLTQLGGVNQGGITSWFNPAAPPVLVHPNIDPQGSRTWFNNGTVGYGPNRDIEYADVPYYNPDDIMPFDMLGPEGKAVRREKSPAPAPRSASSLARGRIRDETEAKMKELRDAGLYDGPIRGRGAEDNAAWQEALNKSKGISEQLDTEQDVKNLEIKEADNDITPENDADFVMEDDDYTYYSLTGIKLTKDVLKKYNADINGMYKVPKVKTPVQPEKSVPSGRDDTEIVNQKVWMGGKDSEGNKIYVNQPSRTLRRETGGDVFPTEPPATRQDSLNARNSFVSADNYWKNKSNFYRVVDTPPLDPLYLENINKGLFGENSTQANLSYAEKLLLAADYDKNKPNLHPVKQLNMGFIQPAAPSVMVDDRIAPQGTRYYEDSDGYIINRIPSYSALKPPYNPDDELGTVLTKEPTISKSSLVRKEARNNLKKDMDASGFTEYTPREVLKKGSEAEKAYQKHLGNDTETKIPAEVKTPTEPKKLKPTEDEIVNQKVRMGKMDSEGNKIYEEQSSRVRREVGGPTEPEYMYLDLDEDAAKQYRDGGWVVEDVDSIQEYADGGTVSQMWEKETGTPWSEAKAQGLADGTYDSNMALRKRLVAGEFSNTPAVDTPLELVPESVSIEPTIENNSNFEIPNEITPSAKQTAALSNDKGPEGLMSDPKFAKVYNPHTVTNPFENKVPNDEVEYSIQNAKSFSDAFGLARAAYGPNYIFEYKGRSFGTNKKGEDFKPTNKILKKHKLDTPEVKKRIEQETKEVESPFFSKETIKLEPDGYESWEDAKLRKEEFNKQDNADKIIDYHKNSPSKNNFVIVDKSKGLMHIYKPNGELLYSEAFDVNTGKNEGDDQTVTKPKDLDGDGRITNDGDRINGKFQPDWSSGNKKTGAGKYYISNIDPTGYKGLPILNMMNERQYDKFKETGKVDNVATSFHKGYISGDDTRRSNGCVRCTKPTLEALTSSLKNLSEVYILPDNDENKFVYENGQLNFRPKLDKGTEMTEDGLSYLNPKTNEKSNVPYYKDERGDWQQGQGVNKTNKTLNYIPITVNTDVEALKTWGDKNMSGGYDGTLMSANYDHFESAVEPFANSLAENKQNIMRAAQINGDVYNEIAKMTLGIYGTESSFGDTHSSGNNFVKAARKWWSKENSSPDYYTKYNTYGATGDDNSVGLTQYRWKWALEDAEKGGKELEVLKKVGITKNSDFMDPEKAALGTAAILAYRYNTQLSPEQKKDMWNHLPGKWNTRSNYGDRVKDNSSLFSISQMTEEANNERVNETDKINKKREEDALPANVQARYEASLKRKAELEEIEAAKSPEQKAREKKVRNDEYIPEAESTGINMPTFEQYPQLNFSKKDKNYGSAKTLSAEEADRLRPKRPRTKAETNKAYRTWANSTPELTKRYGKKSIYDLDATGKPNEWFDKAYKAGKEEYKASLLPVKKNPPNLHLRNYGLVDGGESDSAMNYLKGYVLGNK